MKKSLQLICLTFVALIIGTGLKLMYSLPIDTQPYIEKKYAGWNGVLQAWICSDWDSGSSFIRWLNSCASDFEKSHAGVYLEFTPVSTETLSILDDGNIRNPHLMFFSPGTFTNANLLSPIQSNDRIRNDLQGYGDGRALPVAMGGYIWAYNSVLCDTIPTNPDEISMLTLPSDKRGYSYSAALLGLLSSSSSSDTSQPVPLDNGIDLGLPALSANATIYSDDALDLFISGDLPYVPVCSKDLVQLIRLRDNGKGPEWKLYPSGNIACSDQLLMGGVHARYSKSECGLLAEEFLQLLLSEESQVKLADIGVHGVTGERIHSEFSAYGELDAFLNSRPLWLPACFSEYSAADSETIVRGFLNKDLSVKKALGLLGFEGM